MFVIGTAGHVDHGKSSLIKALTGIDPDRLPEEKLREMTIDLGFAWLALDNGEEVGIVDVPGHERFIKNMIAGAGAVNAVLFVVAADDGWMPQSQEHLDILTLLRLQHGILVLTKIDLAEPDWLSEVEADIRMKVRGTFLQYAPLVKVSSRNGEGILQLKQEIAAMLKRMGKPRDTGKPRLYVDRVFSVAGRGTVVTGSLGYGKLDLNQEVEILPQKIGSRIREIQTHKKSLKTAQPGSRVAVNLAGLEKEKFSRGTVISSPDLDRIAKILYLNLGLLPQIKWSFKKSVRVQVMLGTAEVLATARLLDKKELKPGEEGLVELRLQEQLAPRYSDRVVLRLPGPQLVIGGGAVLDWLETKSGLCPSSLVHNLSRRINADLPGLILAEIEKLGMVKAGNLLSPSHYSKEEIANEIGNLLKTRKLQIEGEYLYSGERAKEVADNVLHILEEYHQMYPFKPGLKSAELGDKLNLPGGFLGLVLSQMQTGGRIKLQQGCWALASFSTSLPGALSSKSQRLLDELERSGFSPPQREDLVKADPDMELVISYLVQKGELLELRDGLLLRTGDLTAAKEKITQLFARKDKISVSDVREVLATSRKYAVPILERLDQLGITKRKGDFRIKNENQ